MKNNKFKKNKNAEQDMVNDIREKFPLLFVKEESSESVQGKTDKCDITLRLDNNIYHLEAKHTNECNKANYSKQILTECIMNRKYHEGKNQYGIVVDWNPESENNLLSFLKNHIKDDDWITFGKQFNCTIIFLYDEKLKTLHYIKWNDLYSDSISPTLVT